MAIVVMAIMVVMIVVTAGMGPHANTHSANMQADAYASAGGGRPQQ